MGPLIMLYHIELFEYTLITILFTIYLTFGIGMAKFLGFQNRGFVREKNYYQLVLLGQVVTNIYPIVPCPLPLAPTRPLPLSISP